MRFLMFQPELKIISKEEMLQMAVKAVEDGKIKRVKDESDFDAIVFALAEGGVATFDRRLLGSSPGGSTSGVSK